MKGFMIERLKVSGEGVEDAVVDFSDGLNVIRGRSNTGKTWVLKCAYYLFSSDSRPFSPLTGYTDIEGTFLTAHFGRIVMQRALGEEIVTVSSESEEVEDGEYDTNYRRKGRRYLNDLWLRIIGLEETIMVPKNMYYARERISWTNIASVFYVDENEVAGEGSIVLKDNDTATALIASLYYLLTGDYKEGVEEAFKPEIKRARKDAVLEFIEGQRTALMRKRSDYLMQLAELSGVDIEQEMENLEKRLRELRQMADGLVDEDASISRQLTEYQRRDASCQVLADRYESLIDQYKADLQRLDFISRGRSAVEAVPRNGACPFCGGELHPEGNCDFAKAMEAEARRIASELVVTAATQKDVLEEQQTIQESISELRTRRRAVRTSLDETREAMQGVYADMERYHDRATLQRGMDLVNEQLTDLGQKEADVKKRKKNPPRYHAKEEFEGRVGTDFDEILNRIIKDCNYRSGGYASWDFNTFDILIDGVPKSEGQGQGYTSFFNSAVALMLYEYFNKDDAFIKPGFLMIDTPLLGFDESESSDKTSIKIGLYQYFIEHQGDGQVIVVDNIGVMPDLDFESNGVNIITYHKDEKDNHAYGFMPSWRVDLPKEDQ